MPDSTANNADGSSSMTVADFLLRRVTELGITDIFGVPGDFNLELLDVVEDHPDLRWVGCCNELNAAYAADGYARVKGISCLVTTFGVGELSAVNGVAGAYSEMLPVIHIVGTPSRKSQSEGAILHHTLGNGDFRVFERMYSEITVAHTVLTPENAVREVDRVITEAYTHLRPVYISLPTDVAFRPVVGTVQSTPIQLMRPSAPEEAEVAAINQIMKALEKAKSPVLLLDALALRQHAIPQVLELVNASGLPVYAAPMGKSGFPETHPQFRGVYLGEATPYPWVKEEVESADLCILVGPVKSDFNHGGFTYRMPETHRIELYPMKTVVFHATFENVGMKSLLPRLTRTIQTSGDAGSWMTRPPPKLSPEIESGNETSLISQAYFWPTLSKYLMPGDIIVADTGTAEFGILGSKLPKDALCFSQILWGSIGWSVGAAVGCGVAAPARRVVLLVGDGSLQMTAQELSTMARLGLRIVVLVLNNDGYTIERLIRGGPTRKYNDIHMWKYADAWNYFSTKDNASNAQRSHRVSTRGELERVLRSVEQIQDHHLIEVMMGFGKMDAPSSLVDQVKVGERKNTYGF